MVIFEGKTMDHISDFHCIYLVIIFTNPIIPISGLLLGPLAVLGEGRALPPEALSVGDGHVQRKMQEGLQGEHSLPDS